MNAHKHLPVLFAALLFLTQSAGAGEKMEDFLDMDLEALLNTEVVSASRRVQKISEAPNAISVITAEDIKRSGAVDLPDLFRMVPGVDVINIYENCYGVSARGFNERFARTMLVMIDGRSIYTSLFGGVFWENGEVFLEDIERIEVIRGPGATMWGANSVTGVINIITKDPNDDQGLLLTQKFGTKNHSTSTLRWSRRFSETLSFSVTAGYREDEGARGTNDYRRVPKATGRIRYDFSDSSRLHLFFGANESDIGMEVTTYTDQTDCSLRSNYQMLRWEHWFSKENELQLQAYRSSYELHTDDKKRSIEEDTYDLAMQHSFVPLMGNRINWGLNYRTVENHSNILSRKTDHDDIIGCFIQYEIDLSNRLRFVAGIKYENNSFTGRDFSSRGCILYSPWDNYHFRLSMSRAFTTPSFAPDSMHITETLPSPLPQIPLLTVAGNRHLDPERMTAYEFGFRTTLFNRIGLNVELYYNIMDRAIDFVTIRKIPPVLISLDKCYKVVAKGVEIELHIPVTRWWSLSANYTFQGVEQKRFKKDQPGTPRHKFNLCSSFTFQNGFSLNLRTHFVDKTKWKYLTARSMRIDGYLRLDMRLSQILFDGKVELSLAGQNLTDKLHPETTDGRGTYEIERLIYGQITLRFE